MGRIAGLWHRRRQPRNISFVLQQKSMLFSAVLLGGALLSGLAGVVMIGAGIAFPSGEAGGGSIFGSLPDVLPGGGDGPDRPGYEDGHPVGLYLMTRYWIATGSLEKAVYYFTDDGRVYVDLEDGFSDDILAQHKGRRGTVRAEGDDMIVSWSDGKEERSNLEKADGGFNWNTGIFATVKPFRDEKDLAGKWEGGASVSFSGSTAMTSNTLELRADGTFDGFSIASLRSTSTESDVSAGGQSDRSGTWKLEGYSLVLQYQDGRTVRGITFPFDDEETPVYPDRFYFSGTMYKKQG